MSCRFCSSSRSCFSLWAYSNTSCSVACFSLSTCTWLWAAATRLRNSCSFTVPRVLGLPALQLPQLPLAFAQLGPHLLSLLLQLLDALAVLDGSGPVLPSLCGPDRQ